MTATTGEMIRMTIEEIEKIGIIVKHETITEGEILLLFLLSLNCMKNIEQ